MNQNYYEREIKEQSEYLQRAKEEKEGYKELTEAFENFATGFTKISRFLKSQRLFMDSNIKRHQDRVDVLKKEQQEQESKMSKENKTLNKHENGNGVICCGALEGLNIKWLYLADQTKCIPHIKNIQEDIDLRVNFCPVCGTNVRSAIIQPSCKGNCGSNYCDEHGCIDKKPTVDESDSISTLEG